MQTFGIDKNIEVHNHRYGDLERAVNATNIRNSPRPPPRP